MGLYADTDASTINTTSADTLAQLVNTHRFTIADESAMQDFGAKLVDALPKNSLVTLSGELGAGKSVLARSMIHALGFKGRVKSPTYTLIETYEAKNTDSSLVKIAHLDLYRLSDPEELDYLGFEDVIDVSDLVLIEWPEQGEVRVPEATVHVTIEYDLHTGRVVKLTG